MFAAHPGAMATIDGGTWIRIATFLPLIVCSIVGFALTLAKWRNTKQIVEANVRQRERFFSSVRAGDYPGATKIADGGPLDLQLAAKILCSAGVGPERLKEHAERLGRDAARHLERGLGGLALIATLGPLFGLLGTVVGIIIIFGQLSATGGQASPHQLAGGIGTALYTTVGGLLIGVLALVSHSFVSTRVDRVVDALESTASELIDLVSGENA